MKKRFDDFNDRGSGWSLEKYRHLDLNIRQVNDLRGGCGVGVRGMLAEKVLSRRAGLINIKNTDDRCLLYCIACKYLCRNNWPWDKKSDPESYSEFVDLIHVKQNDESIVFPISLNDIDILEDINRKNNPEICFRVNVFREDMLTGNVHIVRKSSYTDGVNVNVLYTEFEIDGVEMKHYILIFKDTFLKKKYVNPATMKVSTSNTIFCNRCFSHFRTENSLAMHSKLCNTGESVIRVFPNKGETLSYSEHQYNYRRIYTGYADFESLLKKTNNIHSCEDCLKSGNLVSEKDCNHSYTVELSNHEPISVCFIIVDRYGKLVHEYVYTGHDCVVKLIRNMLNCEEKLVYSTKFNKYMEFGEKERLYHSITNVCHICNNRTNVNGLREKPFSASDIKVCCFISIEMRKHRY